jgi:thymidine kinase
MSLEIVLGPMFSGKSTYALSFLRRQKAIGRQVLAVKPNIDIRYSIESLLVTHNKESAQCLVWDISKPLYELEYEDVDCIIIEEAQFFEGLQQFVWKCLRSNKTMHILLVGLDGDANQQPFGEISECIPLASSIVKLNALCSQCKDGTEAPYTIKKTNVASQIDVGGSDKYEAVCLKHLCS